MPTYNDLIYASKWMASPLTDEEKALIARLSKSPKCMHNPENLIERDYHWQCGDCGLIARKTISIMENTNELL